MLFQLYLNADLTAGICSAIRWNRIQASGALLSMKRTHIHFATLPSHMRVNKWVNVFLLLKTAEAMAAGYEFFLSDNSVLLCEEALPVEYVQKIDFSDLPSKWKTVVSKESNDEITMP